MRAESRQEKGRFSSFLFLTLQTTLVSLYLEKKIFRAFPASPFNTFSYFLADVSRGQGSEAEGARLGSHPADKPWERKVGSKQVPVVLHGDKEDNQAVEDVSRSKQELCDNAEPSSCFSMGCSTFGAITGGTR